MVRITKGLDLPISGEPEDGHEYSQTGLVRSVALVGYDYHGLKPTMEVQEGDQVIAGQVVCTDKKTPGVLYTAPATGRVSSVHRGAKRLFQSLVIELEGDESREFTAYDPADIQTLSHEAVTEQLRLSGEWVALRTRPYSRVPRPGTRPHSIFVTAMDTRPLAARVEPRIAEATEAFSAGLALLVRLTEGLVQVCCGPPGDFLAALCNGSRLRHTVFAGPHPAGLAGTHIHFLDPVGVNADKQVWYIGYQDVIAWGRLFLTGRLHHERTISLAGPAVSEPRVIRSRLGASLEELTAGQLEGGENRLISGSVLDGRHASGPLAYLGRYHNQVSVIREGRERELLHYLRPGADRFSVLNTFLSALTQGRKFAFSSSTNGSARAMVPIGSYERLMPLDILPTQLLRSLLVGDLESAQALGCMELDEEDLALCTFACPGKYEYGPVLRDVLTRIEQGG